MKNKKNKKINKIVALTLLVSILSLSISFAPFPVYSVSYTAGAVSSFELTDNDTGKNVLGTVLNKSAANDIATYENPFVCARLSFSGVQIYIDGGEEIPWNIFYWRAESLNPKTAEVVGEHKITADKTPVSDSVYNENYYLRIDALAVGTTVINVEISASADMKNSVLKTFTVKVIDDSNDGEIKAAFHKGLTGSVIDLNYEVRINMTETAEILIASVTGYDYSNLNASFEKPLTSYSWTAKVINNTEAAEISASLGGEYSDTASSAVDENAGGRTFYIKPKKEGAVDIEFTITPGNNQPDKFKTSSQIISIYISRVVGGLEVNPVSEIYGEGVAYGRVGLTLEDLRIAVNGENKTVEELTGENKANLTAYITVPKNKISPEIIIDEDGSLWGTNPADISEVKCAVDMSVNFLREPFIYVPLTAGSKVKIEIEGYVYNEYKYISKTIDIVFIAEKDNGKIASLSFTSGGEQVYPKQTLEVKVDKDGGAVSVAIIENFEVEIYDSGSPLSGYKSALDPRDYIITAETAQTGTVKIDYDEYGGRFIIMPLKAGVAKIKVSAALIDGNSSGYSGSSFDVEFNISSSNIGMRTEDEGVILGVELKRDNTNQKIYTGKNRIIYLKNGIGGYGALTINIDKVTVTANKPETGYVDELKNFKWNIFINYQKSVTEILNADEIKGVAVDGKADIKIGTERIFKDTGTINITIKITPQRKSFGEDGEEIFIYDDDRAFDVYFGITVNELGAKFLPEIDYENERIFIVTSKISGNKSYYDFDGAPEYMYALKAAGDGESQSAEKWIPFMGSSMDISRLIPKNGTAAYRIAIRELNSEPEEDGFYSENSRKTVNLNPRRAVTAAERKSIIYQNEKIIYNGLESGTEYIFYKVGISDFALCEINAESGISLPKNANPLGNTVTVKFAAYTDADSENGENNRFASAEFKIKIPGIGRLPAINENKKGKYGGFSGRILWSASGGDGSWENCFKGAVRFENLKYAFPDLQADKTGEFYNLYLKNSANSKNAESNVMILKIPADRYEQ